MIKRFSALATLAALIFALSLSFTACSDKSLPVKKLNVYNWGEYISDGSEDSYDTNAEFESYWNENLAEKYGYEITVNYTTYASNEDMYNKIVSGSAKYDVIFPSDYMIQRMASEGLLYDFSPSENEIIKENYQYIDDKFKGEFYDPEERYTVAYTYGVVGVIYNTDYVSEESAGFGTWSLMWNSDYAGKILQFNNSRDAFGTALYSLNEGVDIVNSIDRAVWQRALERLKEQKPLVQAYVMDEIFNKMQTSSSYISAYYAGDFLTMHGENDSLDFYYPTEGTNIYVDAMCIPANAPNKDAAVEYINFMLSEEAAIANAEYTCYASPNKLVYENEEYIEYINDCYGRVDEEGNDVEMNFESGYDILYIEDGTIPVSFYHSIQNTSENENLLSYTNSLWEELKIEDSGAAGVYIVAGAIALLLLSWAAFIIIRNKIRESKY